MYVAGASPHMQIFFSLKTIYIFFTRASIIKIGMAVKGFKALKSKKKA